MNELEPYQGASGGLLPRDARRSGRAISRVSSGGVVRQRTVDVATDVAVAKTSSITEVTASMMADITRVAQLQQHCEQLVPQASGRLNMVADDHALSLMEQAAAHRRGLGRM